MGYDDFILTVNSSSIIILLGMAAVLLAATRFRGESGYAAAIIVLPNVPVYIYNMSRIDSFYVSHQLFGQYAADAIAMALCQEEF